MPVTLRDIARRVNLSHATVSFVLNGRMDVSIPAATRERVAAAAREMGYRPNRAAQALVRGRANSVALWAPASGSSVGAHIQRELARLAWDAGYELSIRLFAIEERADAPPRGLDDWPVDGLFVLNGPAPSILSAEPRGGIPIVSLGTRWDLEVVHLSLIHI